MPIELNATHDPARWSWVESANAPGTDFPIQNLPFGVFDDGKGARGGVALGDSIIDLAALVKGSAISGEAAQAGGQAKRHGRPHSMYCADWTWMVKSLKLSSQLNIIRSEAGMFIRVFTTCIPESVVMTCEFTVTRGL